jgi:protein TonB
MMFSGEPKAPETVSVRIPHVPPVEIQKELAENAAKILEVSQISAPEPAPAKPVEHVKLYAPPIKSSLQDEELKIPSWLEPLARNAAAPSSTQDLIEKEKAKRLAEQQPKTEEIAAEAATAVEEPFIPELPLPTFSDALPLDEEKNTRKRGSKSSGHGVQIAAFAAVVLALAVGAWWYITQPSGGAHASAEPASTSQASLVSSPVESSHSQPPDKAPVPANTSTQTNPAALTNTAAQSNSASKTLSVVPASGTVAAASRNPQPSPNPANSAAAATPAPPVAAVEQPKKPVLGNVRLATPKVTAKRGTQNSGELDAGLVLSNEDQPESRAEALNAGLVGGNAQPSAPVAALPVGGDVKQAKLISSVPPMYPALAKNQHISGNVQIDALIDANGRVTTMKVVSGPTLLQQAAMDALKQWKYQPAQLDGKPVAMHLTVTLQFRLQ